MALDDMGQAWVWGANAEGQLGTGDVAQRSQPAVVQYLGGKNVVRVAAGAYHTLFLTDAGQLFSAGLNTNGQLDTEGEVINESGASFKESPQEGCHVLHSDIQDWYFPSHLREEFVNEPEVESADVRAYVI